MAERIKKRLTDKYAVFLIFKSRLFDADQYAERAGLWKAGRMKAAAHYYNGGWKQNDPSPEFNGHEYLKSNTDVREAGICPLYHYEHFGKKEGRLIGGRKQYPRRLFRKNAEVLISGSKFFDAKWYAEQAGLGKAGKMEAAAHYYSGGWRTYDPSPEFDGQKYLRDNPDVLAAGLCPLYHYERFGKKEGRLFGGKQRYRRWRVRRALGRAAGRLLYRKEIRKNRSVRILAALQLFYPGSWREIKEYLKNLGPYTYDLIITYQRDFDMGDVLEDIRRFKPDARLTAVDNIGFDLGAFRTSLQGVNLEDYDIVFKIHSKGTTRRSTYIYGQLFKYRDWFLYLYEGILGGRTVHKTIDVLTNDPKCGLVAADNLLVHDPGFKQNLTRAGMKSYPEIEVPEDYIFVAGTCFAVRAETLRWFQRNTFPFDKFARGNFSLAHVLERVICFLPVSMGYEARGNRVCLPLQKLRKKQSKEQQKDAEMLEALLSDERFDIDSEFSYKNLSKRRIESYELTTETIRNIKRVWFDGRVIPLEECAPYQYLCGDTEAYEAYCQYHKEHNLYPMSKERFDGLIRSLEEEGFNERNVIVLNQDLNSVMDGQHRLCYLLKKYGKDYIVPVVRIKLRPPRRR